MPRTATQKVGRTVVHIDSHGNPFKFERDGIEVPCVCDPDSGMTCLRHDPPADVHQPEPDRGGYWEPSPVRFGMVRWHSTS